MSKLEKNESDINEKEEAFNHEQSKNSKNGSKVPETSTGKVANSEYVDNMPDQVSSSESKNIETTINDNECSQSDTVITDKKNEDCDIKNIDNADDNVGIPTNAETLDNANDCIMDENEEGSNDGNNTTNQTNKEGNLTNSSNEEEEDLMDDESNDEDHFDDESSESDDEYDPRDDDENSSDHSNEMNNFADQSSADDDNDDNDDINDINDINDTTNIELFLHQLIQDANDVSDGANLIFQKLDFDAKDECNKADTISNEDTNRHENSEGLASRQQIQRIIGDLTNAGQISSTREIADVDDTDESDQHIMTSSGNKAKNSRKQFNPNERVARNRRKNGPFAPTSDKDSNTQIEEKVLNIQSIFDKPIEQDIKKDEVGKSKQPENEIADVSDVSDDDIIDDEIEPESSVFISCLQVFLSWLVYPLKKIRDIIKFLILLTITALKWIIIYTVQLLKLIWKLFLFILPFLVNTLVFCASVWLIHEYAGKPIPKNSDYIFKLHYAVRFVVYPLIPAGLAYTLSRLYPQPLHRKFADESLRQVMFLSVNLVVSSTYADGELLNWLWATSIVIGFYRTLHWIAIMFGRTELNKTLGQPVLASIACLTVYNAYGIISCMNCRQMDLKMRNQASNPI